MVASRPPQRCNENFAGQISDHGPSKIVSNLGSCMVLLQQALDKQNLKRLREDTAAVEEEGQALQKL